MNRFMILLLSATLSGCATYGRYSTEAYSRSDYYAGPNRSQISLSSSYYRPGYRDYGRYPDYVIWSDYYSVLWPLYRRYYDPFYAPSFFYGVTFYPTTYFGLHQRHRHAWPRYHAYAPYRHSYYDRYYDRRGHHRRQFRFHPDYPQRNRRNEAQRLGPGNHGNRYLPHVRPEGQLLGRHDRRRRESEQYFDRRHPAQNIIRPGSSRNESERSRTRYNPSHNQENRTSSTLSIPVRDAEVIDHNEAQQEMDRLSNERRSVRVRTMPERDAIRSTNIDARTHSPVNGIARPTVIRSDERRATTILPEQPGRQIEPRETRNRQSLPARLAPSRPANGELPRQTPAYPRSLPGTERSKPAPVRGQKPARNTEPPPQDSGREREAGSHRGESRNKARHSQ